MSAEAVLEALVRANLAAAAAVLLVVAVRRAARKALGGDRPGCGP